MPEEPAVIARAREDLKSAATELEALCRHLREVHARVPPSPQEELEDFVGEFDVPHEIRTVLEGVAERLGSEVALLRAAADYRPEGGR